MTLITCQVVNEDHQGLPGMRVTLECSGGYQLTSYLESITDQRGIASRWVPRNDYGSYGYGGFAGLNADLRISLTFVTERFFCIPAPWADIRACINTASTGPANHHVLLRFSRDKGSYQIVHTPTPLTPPALEPSQVPDIDWNSDLCIDLTKTPASSPDLIVTDAADTSSSPMLPPLVLASFDDRDRLLHDIRPTNLKRKGSFSSEEEPPRKRQFV